MEIVLLDLSRNVRSPLEILHGKFPGSVVVQVSKAEWKKLNATGLLGEIRGLKSDLFVIAVDEVATAQDILLFEALAVLSSARKIGILETSTATLHPLGRARFLALTLPRIVLEAGVAALFAGAFYLLLLILSCVVHANRRKISAGYGMPRDIHRVAYLRTDLALNIKAGGSITHTRGVIQGFHQNGRNVAILSNEDAPWLQIPSCPLSVLRRTRMFSFWRETERMSNGLWFAWQARHDLRELRPDVLYQRKSVLDLSGVVLSLWLGVPLIIEANDCTAAGLYWERVRFMGLVALVERLQFRAASMAVSISTPVLDLLNARHCDTDRTRVIVNGVNAELFDTPEVNIDAARLRMDYGYLQSDVVIGFVGTFGQWHGIHTLAAGMVEILQQSSGVKFLLIGDGELRASCETSVRDGGVAERVCFAGLLPAGSIPAHLACCDILVSPHSRSPDGTRFIGSPTKLFEYMAAGRAIVASRLDQIGEILEDRRTALLFEPDDVPGFISALKVLVADGELRARIGRQAKTEVTARYTWDANVREVLNYMGEVATVREREAVAEIGGRK
jgi:glycosyltransferase involved in cell wall biosynthesis